MNRGERLIKLSDSWFSAKPILVGLLFIFVAGLYNFDRKFIML